jgi:T5SS/PEP-CTERM-associated repeat protein
MDLVRDRCGGDGGSLRLTRRHRAARARRGALLVGTALAGALAMLAPSSSNAQDATWAGSASGDWNTNGNWVPASVPTGVATFDNTGLTQAVTVSANASINTMTFAAAAPAYSFTINPGVAFDIVGAGIVNNSANVPTFVNNGSLSFANSSTAANATITTNADALTQFTTNSTGGNAQFITNAGGTVDFSGTSGPAGNNQITAGSIAGGGTYSLGANELTVGGNDLSTVVSGSIVDSGAGASLVKVGAGTLTLTGAGNNIGGDLDLCACNGGGITLSGGAFVVGGTTFVTGGTLAISNAGTLTTANLGVGSNMTIDGAGSTATVTGNTAVGVGGPGTLTISGGGVLDSQGPTEIDSFLGLPSVTVTGTGSRWNVGGPMTVGNGAFGGPGSLTIANGATVNANGPFMEIGDEATGTSQVTVTGAGSVLNVTGRMAVGDASGEPGSGPGSLTIANGGVVNVTGRFTSPGRSRSAPSAVAKLERSRSPAAAWSILPASPVSALAAPSISALAGSPDRLSRRRSSTTARSQQISPTC